MRFRTSLLLLVGVTVAPIVAFGVIASSLFVTDQQQRFIVAATDRNRALMSAVDAQLGATIASLQTLAVSRSLAQNDLEAFRDDAAKAVAVQPSWLNVILQDPGGRQLMNTIAAPGAALPQQPVQPGSFGALLARPAPTIGDVVAQGGPLSKQAGIPIRVPILRDGRLAWVLTANVKPDSFTPLLAAQRLPAGWVTGIVDRSGHFVARIPPRPVGSPATEAYRTAVAAQAEGWYRGLTVEGLDTYTAHARSALSGWSVGFAIPANVVLAGARAARLWFAVGIGVSLLLAGGLALWLSATSSRAMRRLSEAAATLGERTEPIEARSSIDELRALGRSLESASATILSRDIELRRSEQRFRLAQETSVQGFAVFAALRDASGEVIDVTFEYVNTAGARFSHRRAEKLIGRRVGELYPNSHRNGILAQLRRTIETGESFDLEVNYGTEEQPLWMRQMGDRISEDRVATSFIDITKNKQLERELRQRAEDLQLADANKSRFLAVLSHELRNPLAPLVNGIALLRRGGGAVRDDTLAMMDRQITQMRRLIDDLLDVSRIDRGKVDLRRQPLRLDDIVRGAVETARPNVEARRQTLVVRDEAQDAWVNGDRVRLGQVVSNLLNNAAKFTPVGGWIRVSTRAVGHNGVVTVEDNGGGFSPTESERIFDMFFQRESAQGGLGLGLTLARSLVTLHGGELTAESDGPGRGARFTVRLPLVDQTAVPDCDEAAGEPGGGRRILVVDDNADAAESLARLLAAHGHDARAAYGGDEALATAEELRPQVAFLDVNMPGIDGLELARRLRTRPWGGEVALVAVTGMGQRRDVERSLAAGFDAHLTKPAAAGDIVSLAASDRTGASRLAGPRNARGAV